MKSETTIEAILFVWFYEDEIRFSIVESAIEYYETFDHFEFPGIQSSKKDSGEWKIKVDVILLLVLEFI